MAAETSQTSTVHSCSLPSALLTLVAALVAALVAFPLQPVLAAESMEQKLQRLERALAEQQRHLEAQRIELERVRTQIKAQELATQRGRGPAPAQSSTAVSSAADAANAPTSTHRGSQRVAQSATQQPKTQQQQSAQQPTQEPVGKAPEPSAQPERPVIPQLAEVGGVLTPKGTLVLEPGMQYSNSQVNRFTFVGIEILSTFLIGLLEAEDVDRDLYSPQITARYGLTDRIELEAKVPYLFREDRLTATIPQVVPPATITRELDGDGLGDIELAAHYQLNKGGGKWPYFIANLRWKSTTGTGPFEVDRTPDGVFETELPTGSGFHSIEPSVTALLRTDPAVIFANVGYLFNIEDDINKTFGDQTIETIDPGDAFRLSFGMAFSVNPRASFSLGYKHDFIGETETTINGVSLTSSSLDVGALLVGFSYRITDRVSTNLNLELGVTADAPDALMTLRVPMTFGLF